MKLKIIIAALLIAGAASPAFAKKANTSGASQGTGIQICDQVLTLEAKCSMGAAKNKQQQDVALKRNLEAIAGFREAYDTGNKEVIDSFTNFCQQKYAQYQKTGCTPVRKNRPGEEIF